MQRQDFTFELPAELIAQQPLPQREASRLLCLGSDGVSHGCFTDLPGLLRPEDLLVVNDTQVIKARLAGEKDSGGRAEILLERILDRHLALCQVRVSKALKVGRTLKVDGAGGARIAVVAREGEFYTLRFPVPVLDFLERFGEVPLPPYIQRPAGDADAERYQTIYRARPGAVAAPTAGLHFTESLLEQIRSSGVDVASLTLHVGAGTFQPVRVDDLDRHRMHRERYRVPKATRDAVDGCRQRGGRVVAVGTTVVRALESACGPDGSLGTGWHETDIFITPGFSFRVVDALVTNFHLPESTLLMLVCAFGGTNRVLEAYSAAVREGYRFFSYGDAMFLERGIANPPSPPRVRVHRSRADDV